MWSNRKKERLRGGEHSAVNNKLIPTINLTFDYSSNVNAFCLSAIYKTENITAFLALLILFCVVLVINV